MTCFRCRKRCGANNRIDSRRSRGTIPPAVGVETEWQTSHGTTISTLACPRLGCTIHETAPVFTGVVLFCALLSASPQKARCRDIRTLRRPRATWRAQNQPGSFLPQILPVPAADIQSDRKGMRTAIRIQIAVQSSSDDSRACLLLVSCQSLPTRREQVRSDLRVAWLVCA